jgi:hypothetical protein
MVRVEDPCSLEQTGVENGGHTHNRRLYAEDSFTPLRTGCSTGEVPAR